MKKLYRKGTVHPSPPLVSDHLSFLPATILTLAAALTTEDKEVLAYLISCSAATNNNNCIFPTGTTTTYPKKNNSTSSHNNTGSGGGGGGGKGSPTAHIGNQDQKNSKNGKHKNKKIHQEDIVMKAAGVGGVIGEEVDHPTRFDCNCFRCYMSYWVRWDSSPNRQLIHEIIDAYEDKLLSSAGGQNNSNNNNKGTNNSKLSRRERKKKGKNGGLGSPSTGNHDEMNNRTSELALPSCQLDELVRTVEPVIAGGGAHDGGEDEGRNLDDNDDEVAEKGSVRKIVSFIGEKIWNVWG